MPSEEVTKLMDRITRMNPKWKARDWIRSVSKWGNTMNYAMEYQSKDTWVFLYSQDDGVSVHVCYRHDSFTDHTRIYEKLFKRLSSNEQEREDCAFLEECIEREGYGIVYSKKLSEERKKQNIIDDFWNK